ncbi:hypothetical protein B0H10DRAFT_2212733 [Mycena sp. CBHHK59/15]|nr:hypothetical protein B0H10DRAFT_2212733 [Mycena sp. CBHHK59/15]
MTNMDGSDALDEYSYSGNLSSRSSTPGESYHHPPPLCMTDPSSSSMSQGSDDFPGNDSVPFSPHPFRYNPKRAPSIHLDCRQCVVSRRENLILATENTTLKNAYEALLNVVGPVMFLVQAPGPSNLAATPSGLGGLPSLPSVAAPNQSNYPRVPFWYAHEYKTHLDQTKGINVAMQYVTDANGVVIDGFRATAIRSLATKLFAHAAASGAAPATWSKAGLEMQTQLSAEICRQFAEMGLCANDWKVQYMVTKMYSGWYRGYIHSQGIKSEPPAAPVRVKVSKETKAAPGTSTTPRNLCMISWCKKHPRGFLSQFKLYWDSIEKTPDSEEFKQASADAAASKTKAAS